MSDKLLAWIFLIISSILEIGWMISVKYTQGFTKIIPMICFTLFGLGATFFLSKSLKEIPMGVAYDSWMSLAVVGALIIDMLYLKKPYNIFKIICMALIVIGIVGLKVASNDEDKKDAQAVIESNEIKTGQIQTFNHSEQPR